MGYAFDIEYELSEEGRVDVVEYFVTALDEATGRVLRHNLGFRTHELFIDPQTGEEHIVARHAGEAEQEARVLLSAINKRGGIINQHWWHEYVPAAVVS